MGQEIFALVDYLNDRCNLVNKNQMFCYQCEQTTEGKACTTFGVCGKNPDVSALQDLLIYMLRGLSQLALEGQKVGFKDEQLNLFICESAFTTLTNVNFDPSTLVEYINRSVRLRDVLREKVRSVGGYVGFHGPVDMLLEKTKEDLIIQGKQVGINADLSNDPDLHGLHWLLIYGIKGVAAYAYHAYRLGKKDDKVFEFIQQGLAATLDESLGVDDFLKQSQGKGIYVYSHGEMLPAHAYPRLKKHSHFFGHYGTAWQNQQKEFANFPGAILMTTNCLQRPAENYKGNLFTSGPVGWPGVTHLECSDLMCGDFSPVIEKALEMQGFTQDKREKTVTVGFGIKSFLSFVENITESIMKGHINSFFLLAGCDGAKPGRNYYTEFVEKTPNDSLVLTLACGKFRFFDKDLGQVDGIPRLLDIGQCNDAYSAVKVAQAFEEIFKCGISDLPLFFILSWYEQKAVAILLSLFYLGVNIRLGPSLPAFMTPKILERLNIKPLKTPDEDLKAILDYVNGVVA